MWAYINNWSVKHYILFINGLLMKVIIEQSMLHLRTKSNWEYHHLDQSSPLASMNKRITLWERWILRVLFSDEGANATSPSAISAFLSERSFTCPLSFPLQYQCHFIPNHHHLENCAGRERSCHLSHNNTPILTIVAFEFNEKRCFKIHITSTCCYMSALSSH